MAHGEEQAAFDGGVVAHAIFSRLAGYEDTNDAERLLVDPTMRYVVGGRACEHSAASTSQMGRFETEVLTQPGNFAGLTHLSGKWIDRLRDHRPMRELVLDMDSSVSETHGEQEGSAYNGHFDCTCYHPLFCFNQFGDVEGTMLREGHEIGNRATGMKKDNSAITVRPGCLRGGVFSTGRKGVSGAKNSFRTPRVSEKPALQAVNNLAKPLIRKKITQTIPTHHDHEPKWEFPDTTN